MTQLQWYDNFCAAAMMDKLHDPWVRRRKPAIYAEIMIVSCQRPDWWYHNYIGLICLAKLKFTTYHFTSYPILREAEPIRLTNTKEYSGRDIAVEDFIIL